MGPDKTHDPAAVTHNELARVLRLRQPAEPTYSGPCLSGHCNVHNFQGITLNEWSAHNTEVHGGIRTLELWGQAVGPSASRPPKSSEPTSKALVREKRRILNPATDAIPSGKTIKPQRLPDRYELGGRRGNRGAAPRTVNKLLLQLDTRPIHLDQLIAEVKGIYAGLVMVESKCIEVDSQQNALLESQNRPKLSNDHWQAMIALHRTLLHEHHDFLLASQHPAASRPLKRLAAKYSMPARLWRHGIHSFLELMRHRLPDSLDHMLTFLVHAYSMITILYENVTAFRETWIECLGDLGRYRMAIEDSDMHVRETWAMVSRDWYNKASDLTPATGRLYHHLGILSRPHILRQLFYYTKSLCTPIPFSSTRESIVTLFDPVLNPKSELYARAAEADLAFARAYACLFYSKSIEEFKGYVETFMITIDNHISTRSPGKWIASGYQIAIAHCCTLMNYGDTENEIVQEMRPATNDTGRGTSVGESAAADTDHPAGPAAEGKKREKLGQSQATSFVMETHAFMFQRAADGDTQVLAYVNVTLAFAWCLGEKPRLAEMLAQQLPWAEIASALTALATKGTAPLGDGPFSKGVRLENFSAVRAKEFPRPINNWKPRPENSGLPILPRPLPEDYAMRALLGTESYFPADWFDDDSVDDEQKYLEVAGERTPERLERILWLGVRIAAVFGRFLSYVPTDNTFSAMEEDAEMVDAE